MPLVIKIILIFSVVHLSQVIFVETSIIESALTVVSTVPVMNMRLHCTVDTVCLYHTL